MLRCAGRHDHLHYAVNEVSLISVSVSRSFGTFFCIV
jgi:hypothetical protein